MDQIPQTPKPRTIKSEDQRKLQVWINHFRQLSPKVMIKTPSDRGFEDAIKQARKGADNHLPDPTIYHIADWPDLSGIAFFVAIDSSNPGRKPKYEPSNAFIFCFRDYVFGITYHTGEGNHEDGNETNIFSLQSYARDALTWSYITKMIMVRLENLSDVVPEKA